MNRRESSDSDGALAGPGGTNGTAERERLAEQETLADAMRTAPDAGPSSLASGRVLGHYRLVSLLGEGGFGQVWKVEHVDDRRMLALKILTKVHADSARTLERFQREGRIAAAINHPRSVYVFGADQIEGYPVIAQELMVGGTLADHLDKRGCLPAQEAVDRILEVIEGLDAAHQIGALHRDVKPSNCFLDENGSAKIGDYGLSKSLVAESDLTQTSSFIGTPLYSSPEQVRGRGVDVRSDIYSVGATLYTLMTGKPPFTADNAGEVLARIVAEEPAPFSAHAVKVPRGLDKVVMRCLRKDPDRRFKSYQALRRALLPYATGATTAGSLGRRFLAYYIDSSIGALLNGLLGVLGLTAGLLAPALPGLSIHFAYLLLCEWRWGRGLGKYALGLRVSLPTGAPPGFLRVLIRTLVFYVAITGPGFVYGWLRGSELGPEIAVIMPLELLLIVSTMRRRNGFAGIHEVISGTRVQAMRSRSVVTVPERPLRAAAPVEPARIGPFTVRGAVWQNEDEAFLVGWDEALHREFWLHTSKERAPAHAVAASRSRRGALRMLQTGSDTDRHWAAFEAPSGSSFCGWVRERGRLSWKETRRVLLTLARELGARASNGETSAALTLRHLWVDGDGNTKVLDFPTDPEGPDWDRPLAPGAAAWRLLMGRVVYVGLVGTGDTHVAAGVPPPVPLAEHAQTLLRSHLVAAAADEPHGLELFANDLEQVADMPASISRRRRAAFLTALVGPYLVGAASVLLGMWVVSMMVPPSVQATNQYMEELAAQAESVADPALSVDAREGLERKREATRRVLAFYWRDARSSPAFQLPNAPIQEEYGLAEAALADYPDVTKEEARRTIDEFDLAAQGPPQDPWTVARTALVAFFAAGLGYLCVIGALSLLLAVPMRGGPLFSFFGVRLQTRHGERAARGRCLLRAVVAWAPVFAAAVALATGAGLPLFAVLLAVAIAGALYSIRNPECGIPDWVAGTRLVPR